MSEIAIKCPQTGNTVSTGIESDSDTFARLPFVVSSANCPHCGKHHLWTKKQAWLNVVDSEPADRRDLQG